MTNLNRINLLIANTMQQTSSTDVLGDYIELFGEQFYRIQNYDAMPPFFISLVSSSNHWLFISTTGGLTAGRIDADHAIFPYYTEDKISESPEHTGSKSILQVTKDGATRLWEPFSNRYQGLYKIKRTLYKNVTGTALIFEEVNADLELTFRYGWRTGERFGFVKTAWLINMSANTVQVNLLDGLQNVLPANVSADVQNQFSVLLDAYKRSELDIETGLGIYSLSSRLTDIAEPSESLRANVVWQVGLKSVSHLLASHQLERFRNGQAIELEHDIRGKRGAYFIQSNLELTAKETQQWHIVSDVFLDTAQIVELRNQLGSSDLGQKIEFDLQSNHENLVHIVATADGLQMTADHYSTNHHFANVLFNIMRGGIFVDQYRIATDDLRNFIHTHNKSTLEANQTFFETLPQTITVGDLKSRMVEMDDLNLIRLCYSYLPLTFSRRHGDPSRPWNRFAIHLKNPDGSQRLTYQGNWRDIFQNWEALAFSYPEFIEGMIFTFLNATTFDGYNPYRITRDGIDWEVPEPSNPWANIGYWSDHQIIYLQKLLETYAKFYPGKLQALLTHPLFSYANVPYEIKPYDQLIKDPHQSIDFNLEKHETIQTLVKEIGADGRLVVNQNRQVVHTSLLEKLLSLMLAKLVNFVPEGGLWMNTQRPEWNDANNALVGWGLSVVTIGYLRRFTHFMLELVANAELETMTLSHEVNQLLSAIHHALQTHEILLANNITDTDRRTIMDQLGKAGSEFRQQYYQHGVSGDSTLIDRQTLLAFLTLTQQYLEHTLRANKREDNLYHAYSILSLEGNSAKVSYLNQMLEGQVAVLSSGLLSPAEALELLQGLRHSALYREDQHTYILYPNRQLSGFLAKNNIQAEDIADLKLIELLVKNGDTQLITQDINGNYHFNGDIRNARDIKRILGGLQKDSRYGSFVASEHERILEVFERVFNHASFTGRSGSFFAYEGLGSIYWHMVSKLLLAVQETVITAQKQAEMSHAVLSDLLSVYYDVRKGLGYNKSPEVYGAFPTDPYSHTPENNGAKQPGMTGMVKEEILTRLTELGLFIEDGTLRFDPLLMQSRELLNQGGQFHYVDVTGKSRSIDLPKRSLAYTFCQVPIIMESAETAGIMVNFTNQDTVTISGNQLAADLSQHLFLRDNKIESVKVFVQI